MSKLLSLLAILATTVHANDTTCGDDPDKVPNCDKPDHGSCGNAWYAAPKHTSRRPARPRLSAC